MKISEVWILRIITHVLSYLGGVVSALVVTFWSHWLSGGRLVVHASIEPADLLDGLFPHGLKIRLHAVNVGRREVRIKDVGCALKMPHPQIHAAMVLDKAPEGSREFLMRDFAERALAPDNEFEIDVLVFIAYSENYKRFFIKDVQGRRFFVPWRDMRRMVRQRRAWEARHHGS